MSLYRRPNSPHWWIRFQLDGREVRLSSGTANRAAAQEFETLTRSQAYRQIRLGERPAYLWTDAARRWLTETRKRSIDIDRRIITWFTQQLGKEATVQQITPLVIEELRKLKAAEQSESTADRYMALMRAILRQCAGPWRVIDQAPNVPMYRPEQPEPRWLTPAQFWRLHAQLPAHLKAAASFAVLTGLRMRAMLSLTWDQVDMAKGRAWIAGVDMKGKAAHGFMLSPDAVKVLKGIRKREGVPWIFHWRGKRVADCNGKAFKDAVRSAGIGDLRWHDLRHTWASWAVQSGVTLQEVMQLGGWKSLAIVMRYAHLAPDHLAEAAAKVRLPAQKPAQRKRRA